MVDSKELSTFNNTMMRYLLFPDFEVRKMELFIPEKKLNIYVEGAYLDLNDGRFFGPGILFFSEWESIEVQSFDSNSNRWCTLNEPFECLEDLLEVKFTEFDAILCGFGTSSHNWLEWKILHSKMSASFKDEVK